MTRLDLAQASRFASAALGHLTREWPNKLDHVMGGPWDVKSPAELHPIFYGSFDWHSCVHGWWTVFTLYRRFAERLPERDRVRALADALFTEDNVEAEIAYLAQPESRGFERPYGWAWALMLVAELHRHDTPEGRRWFRTVEPLGQAFADRFAAFLPLADYPVRAGAHTNTAFALALALEYAAEVDDDSLGRLCRDKAGAWYGSDRACQAWEPSQDDFLSPALVEAECMRRALGPEAFAAWFAGFLPDVAKGEPATLFRPPSVSDRTDGKIAHLDGLALSRAWCWREIASALPPGDPRRNVADQAAGRHLEAALPHVTGDYMGEHWLASFALLALGAGED
jgi:hypothetical protein